MKNTLLTQRVCMLTILSLFWALFTHAQPGDFDCRYDSYGFIHPDGDFQLGRAHIYQSGTYEGKMLLFGSVPTSTSTTTRKWGICRVNNDGTLDTTFGTDGWVKVDFNKSYQNLFNFAVTPTNEIYIVGEIDEKYLINGLEFGRLYGGIAKLDANGNLDTSFDSDGLLMYKGNTHTLFSGIVIQNDGKIVISGEENNITFFRRYNTNGTLDTSYGSGGMLTKDISTSGSNMEGIADMILSADGSVIAAGWHLESGSGDNEIFVMKVTSSGTLDTSFDGDGIKPISLGTGSSSARGLAEDENGKLYIGTNIHEVTEGFSSPVGQIGAVRLNADGSLDTSFSVDGWVSNYVYFPDHGLIDFEVHGSYLQSDGKFVVTGGTYSAGVCRFNTDGSLDTDFGDNGMAFFGGYTGSDWGQKIIEYNDRLYQFGWGDDVDRYSSVFRIFMNDVDMTLTQAVFEGSPADVIQPGDEVVVGIGNIEVCGKLNPFDVTSLTFNTAGTTADSDLATATLYYTTSPTFSNAETFGTTINAPSGDMVFSGSKNLEHKDNYFWLVYTLANDATLGNEVDASFTSYTYDSSPQTPDITTNSTSVPISNYIFYEKIENGTCEIPIGWNSVDQDADNEEWFVTDDYNDLNDSYMATISPKDGCLIASKSYKNDFLTAENWLISKRLDLTYYKDGVLSYWVAAFEEMYSDEKMTVLVSTTDTQTSSFSVVETQYSTTASTWTKHSIDLSAFDGQTIYIAFKHESVESYGGIALDDILLRATATASNTLPSLTVNNSLTLDEGATKEIASSFLSISDNEESGASLAFIITSPPSKGVLKVNGIVTSYFTMEDVTNNLVSYEHDDSDTTTDAFTFTISDGRDNVTDKVFNITINLISDLTLMDENIGDGTCAIPTNWSALDRDADSKNWFVTDDINDLPYPDGIVVTPKEGCFIASNSYEGSALTPENWLITAPVDLTDYNTAKFSYWISGYDNTYTNEKVTVLISTTDTQYSSFSVIENEYSINAANWEKHKIDLSAYDGEVIYIAFKHILSDGDEGYGIALDDFHLSAIENAPALVDENIGDGTCAIPTGWTQYDEDNDGKQWYLLDNVNDDISEGESTDIVLRDGCALASNTYEDALTVYAVNWLISAPIDLSSKMNGQLSYWITAFDNYSSHEAVTVLVSTTDAQPSSFSVLENKFEIYQGDAATWKEHIVDLSAYSGQTIYIAFKHELMDGWDEGWGVALDDILITADVATNNAPTIVTNNTLTLNEGATGNITPNFLSATDLNEAASSLTFTVTTASKNGALKVNNVSASTFTMEDINNNIVTYIHDGSNSTSDEIAFTLSDGIDNVEDISFDITITPVDDDTPVVTNNGKTILEGGNFFFSSGELSATDADSDDNSLTYTLLSIPSQGTLTLSNSTLSVNSTFTQSDILNSNVKYTHNGSNSTGDNFNFTVTDGINSTATKTFTTTITPVDDEVPVVSNSGKTINASGSFTFTTSEVSATDIDTDDATLIYTLSSVPSNGTIKLNNSPLAVNGTFTQSDLTNNLVTYEHNGNNATADNFNFTVTDGINTSALKTFTTTIIQPDSNTPVVATNTGKTIDEGGTFDFSTVILNVTDVEKTSSDLTFTLLTTPSQGTISLNDIPLATNGTFTMEDIENGLVSYLHNDSNSSADNFNFNVTDGVNTTATKTFSITVNPIDDDVPVITKKAETINEGGGIVFNDGQLTAYDNDTDMSNVTVHITSLPTNGSLIIDIDTPIQIGDSLDYSYLMWLSYLHDDSNTTADSFTFYLSDGTNNTTSQTYAISVTPVDDDFPIVSINTGKTINEGENFSFSANILNTTDTDTDNSTLQFKITSLPANGTLKIDNTSAAVNSTFTIAQLSTVSYQHDHSNTTSDSIKFIVTDGTNNTESNTFSITITSVDDDAPQVTNNGKTIDEGGQFSFTNSELSATDEVNDNDLIVYEVLSLPINGTLSIDNQEAQVNSTFTQSQLSTISYLHDDSNTTSDSFTFNVSDGSYTTSTQTFSITVNAIDDDTPILATNETATENEGGDFTFDTSLLNATDTDSDNSSIVYTLTSIPTNGYLAYNGSTTPFEINATFTQNEIASDQIDYTHDGSNTTSDSFSFTLSDGTNSSSEMTFSININPIDDDAPVISSNGHTINEGDNFDLDASMWSATDTEYDDNSITFTIDQLPTNGDLYIDDQIADLNHTFTAGNTVRYEHDDSNTTSDSFSAYATDAYNPSASSTFNITIIAVDDDLPMITNHGSALDEGGNSTISSSELSATDADSDDSSLIYTVTTLSINGNLALSGTILALNDTFTPNDLINSNLVYTHDDSNTTSDTFSFTVSDGTNTTNPTSFTITINAIDDDIPVVSNNGGTLDEGSAIDLSTNLLSATDTDSDDNTLVMVITALPTNGVLTVSSTAVQVNDEINMSQVGTINYEHDNSNTTVDNFTFTVNDGTNSTSSQTFNFTINALDDDVPVIENNSFTLNEGDTHTISNSEISASDTDSDNTLLSFTLISLPDNGEILLNNSPLGVSDSFNQNDITNASVVYRHDNSNSTSDAFSFTVSDGINTSTSSSVSIIINAIDDDIPVLSINNSITVEEGDEATLTSDVLSASDEDSDDATLTYQIIKAPVNGIISFGRARVRDNSTLTQSQINSGNFKYKHDHTNTTSDSLVFTLTDGINTSEEHVLYFEISPVDDNAPIVTHNVGIAVIEGGNITINQLHLMASDFDINDDDITFHIVTTTQSGRLSIGRSKLNNGSTFTQSNLNNGIKYTHDHSDGVADSIVFYITDGTFISENQTFKITLNPIDDSMPEMLAMVDLHLDVDERSTLITKGDLMFEDDFSDATQITYQVTEAPTNGIVYHNQLETEVSSFSQEDINNENILFTINNDDRIAEDSFQFVVSDSVNNSTEVFTLNINAVMPDELPLEYIGTIPVVDNDTSSISSQLYALIDFSRLETETVVTLIAAPTHGNLLSNSKVFERDSTLTIGHILHGDLYFGIEDLAEDKMDSIVFAIDSAPFDEALYSIKFDISDRGNVTALQEQLTAVIDVYPVPFTTSFTLDSNTSFDKYELRTSNGTLLIEKEFDPTLNTELFVDHLSSGLYLLGLRTSQGWVYKKVIKK